MISIRRLACLAILPLAVFAEEKPQLSNFATGTFTEVVNLVSVVKSDSGNSLIVAQNSTLQAPDLVKTGRKSRAQVTLADGTVVRVTANAVFNLDKDSRTLRVDQGAAVFYTPKNAGGGRIVTNSATCSVTGTTVLVEKSELGVRYTLLEGSAKITRADGTSITLKAGRSCFIPTGGTGPLSDQPAAFDSVTASEMLRGFSAPLPSQGEIDATRRSFMTSSDFHDPDLKVNVQVISPNGE